MDMGKSEIAHDVPPYLTVYKDGTIKRHFGTEIIPPSTDPLTGTSSKDVLIIPETGLYARLYRPNLASDNKKIPLVVYFHGGAFIMSSAFDPKYHYFLNNLVAESNVIIASVNYILAPEHPLPAALDDSWSALQWVASHASGSGSEAWLSSVDFDQFYLGGDSAGMESFRIVIMETNELEEEEFGFSRNYFLAKEVGPSGKKSGNKLSDINLVDEQELREAASNIEPKHEKEVKALMNSYKSLYPNWVFELRCGFGLLMYGFGSKKALIEDFASTALTEYTVVVMNGYLQSVNLKQVLITLCEVLWEQLKVQQRTPSVKEKQPFNTLSMEDLLDFLNGPDNEANKCFICVIVHNIDGPGLRDSDTQHYLARISACSHIRIIASVDHVNAPLLWDKKMVHTQYNWCWYHVPTFSPYKVEGIFHPLILVHGGTTQSVKTASIVLQSLTPNAQSVFKVIAEHQLAHPDEEGMPVNNLYTTCRERFLVSSQVTLNSHLTEFKDHELVKMRRHSDGHDCLHIPLSTEAIEKLVLEITQ